MHPLKKKGSENYCNYGIAKSYCKTRAHIGPVTCRSDYRILARAKKGNLHWQIHGMQRWPARMFWLVSWIFSAQRSGLINCLFAPVRSSLGHFFLITPWWNFKTTDTLHISLCPFLHLCFAYLKNIIFLHLFGVPTGKCTTWIPEIANAQELSCHPGCHKFSWQERVK